MKQKQFETEHAALWSDIELVLKETRTPPAQAVHLPALYRRLCQCLALSSQRGYSPQLTYYLHRMATQCHQRLYGTVVERPFTLHHWLLVDFPQRVRREWRLLVVAMLAFWGVALAVGLLVWHNPDWAYNFTSAQNLQHFRQMYSPGEMSKGRGGTDGDIAMFGFYIWNNVSIGFRSFAGGLFGGVPAIISLVANGISNGVVAAWLSLDPSTRTNFWSFVITHSSFEITGFVLAAVAGMRLGMALLAPGRLSRRHALVLASIDMFPVLVGSALMIAFAAFFEAFWSGNSHIPVAAKYSLGALCWTMVIGFFTFAGRGR